MADVINIVEGTYGLQGTVSGTDQTILALTNTTEHTAPNVLRVWIENQTGGVSTAVTSINTVTGTVTLNGADGITVLTDMPNRILTVSGFQTEFVSASGSLQDQIDAFPMPNALEGSDGITVTSGSSTDTISGFYSEFLNASGTLSAEIDTDIATHAAIADAHHVRYSKNENDALTGSEGITIISGSNTIEIQGFYTEFTNASGTLSAEINSDIATHTANASAHHAKYTDAEAIIALEPTTSALAASGVATDANIVSVSGHLQDQIDNIDFPDTSNALVGADGITVTSGTSVDTISGFYAEFQAASGTLSAEIDSDISTHAANASAHHAKYTDAEAISALEPTTSALAASGVVTDAAVSANTALITTTSGYLQTQIDAVEGSDVDSVNGATGAVLVTGTQNVTTQTVGQTITVTGPDLSGYATDAEVATVSGHLSSEIDSDIAIHTAIDGAHHTRYSKNENDAILGTDGITVTSGSNSITVDGFYTEFANASGTLSAEIDSDITTHAALPSAHHVRYSKNENDALTGSDGITVTSGSNTIDIGGFYTEFTNASGTLDTDIDSKVAKAGDTMTGALVIQNSLDAVEISGGPIAITGSSTFFANETIPIGNQVGISIPATAIQAGEGNNVNVFQALSCSAQTTINSAQLISLSSTFSASSKFTETGAITASHTTFAHSGFSAGVAYTIDHNGASTAAVPAVLGFDASPRLYRESGATGYTTISNMVGFATNTPNAFRAAFGAQQVQSGFTVSKYAHFLANSDVTGGLLIAGSGTITEEVGLDLQGLGVGSTAISVRSTSTTATMRHRGRVSFGTTGSPSVSINGTNYNPRFYIESTDGDMYEWVVAKYDDSTVAHYVFARASGTKGSPSAVASSATIFSIQGYGYTSGSFYHVSSFNCVADDTVAAQDIPGGYQFKVHEPGSGGSAVTTALEVRSTLSTVSHGRWAWSNLGVIADTLSSDENDYEPSASRGLWRLTASAADRTITGIAAPSGSSITDFQEIVIINVGASNNVILADQNGSSSAANRIITGTGADLTVGPDQATTLVYDNSTDRWRVISRNF